jgi:beta-galactosidase
MKQKILFALLTLFFIGTTPLFAQRAKHTFTLGTTEFLLDGKPFQIISGEMHPARIPAEYWRQRIQMAKAMGCNTISVRIFWNFHESGEGVFDFTEGNHNIAEFFTIASEEEMWILLKPGPYVDGEWDLGGLPSYLLRTPGIKLRSLDPVYMAAAERYMSKLAEVIKPYLVTKGGPIIMLQIENEYGSYGTDKNYMLRLKEIWAANGIDIPSFTGDKPTTAALEAGTIQGSAVGLHPGATQEDYDLAAKINPGVPVFSSETYSGLPTYWGDKWPETDSARLVTEVKFLMDNKKSFNLNVIHGGTNFEFTAGAAAVDKKYSPLVTIYNYNAPVNEQGRPTPVYMALRELVGSYLTKKQKLPDMPQFLPVMEIPGFFLTIFTSVWDNLPQPVTSDDPGSFETHGLDYGLLLYRTELNGQKAGRLTITDLHDFATVFLNGTYLGTLNRAEGINTIDIPESNQPGATLEILVEGMGRINSGENIIDRKGITGNVTLNSEIIKNWKVFKLPLDKKFIYNLRSTGKTLNKNGIFFKGNISLIENSDTFFDVSNYTKGIIWVNGHNLGRFLNTGPQKRLFCPGIRLKKGFNEVIILDQVENKPQLIISTTSS